LQAGTEEKIVYIEPFSKADFNAIVTPSSNENENDYKCAKQVCIM